MGQAAIPAAMRRRYDAYIKSHEWKARRQRAVELAGYCCEKCGATAWDTKLEVHHLTYERLGDEADKDLVALCPKCHEKADQEREARSRYKSQQALWSKRLNGWATKKYGEDWMAYHDEDAVASEFQDWLDERSVRA